MALTSKHARSGIIAANDVNGVALRGFAPQAEVHVLEVFPGGRASTLIEAIDYCIERQIDIVSVNVGLVDAAEAVEQKLEDAVRAGIAVIAAAGDSGGPVQYPASSPHVLSVAALGILGEFPAHTLESQTIVNRRDLLASDGTFVPSFVGPGPKIDLSAPGVGIVSTVPGGGLGVQSGTSTATAHIAGVAALLVAHHPWVRHVLATRNEQRVAVLYQLIRAAAPPAGTVAYQLELDARRIGAGVPRVERVLAELQLASRGGNAPAFAQQPAAPLAATWPRAPFGGTASGGQTSIGASDTPAAAERAGTAGPGRSRPRLAVGRARPLSASQEPRA